MIWIPFLLELYFGYANQKFAEKSHDLHTKKLEIQLLEQPKKVFFTVRSREIKSQLEQKFNVHFPEPRIISTYNNEMYELDLPDRKSLTLTTLHSNPNDILSMRYYFYVKADSLPAIPKEDQETLLYFPTIFEKDPKNLIQTQDWMRRELQVPLVASRDVSLTIGEYQYNLYLRKPYDQDFGSIHFSIEKSDSPF